MKDRETFTHRGGQTFEIVLEFLDKGRKLILAKSMYGGNTYSDVWNEEDPKYYSAGQWYVFYGVESLKPFDMGFTRLAYPRSTRAVTERSALSQFMRMVRNLDLVTFGKLEA